MRNGLVVAQVTLSLVLFLPAGLLLCGLVQILMADPGFETKKTTVVGYSNERRNSGGNMEALYLNH
jgi:hypothetical protein